MRRVNRMESTAGREHPAAPMSLAPAHLQVTTGNDPRYRWALHRRTCSLRRATTPAPPLSLEPQRLSPGTLRREPDEPNQSAYCTITIEMISICCTCDDDHVWKLIKEISELGSYGCRTYSSWWCCKLDFSWNTKLKSSSKEWLSHMTVFHRGSF